MKKTTYLNLIFFQTRGLFFSTHGLEFFSHLVLLFCFGFQHVILYLSLPSVLLHFPFFLYFLQAVLYLSSFVFTFPVASWGFFPFCLFCCHFMLFLFHIIHYFFQIQRFSLLFVLSYCCSSHRSIFSRESMSPSPPSDSATH